MIQTYLDLSTGHVSQATMETLSFGPEPDDLGWPAMTVAPYKHGCFVTVPGDDEPEQWDALPTDLHSVLKHASQLGATLVRFDSDGDRIDGLSFYSW